MDQTPYQERLPIFHLNIGSCAVQKHVKNALSQNKKKMKPKRGH